MSKHILLVDDETDYLRRLKSYIGSEFPDYNVDCYNPIHEGLPDDSFDWSVYDLLLIDYDMQNSTALDWLGRYQYLDNFPPVIIIAAETEEKLAVKALKLGALDYVGKSGLDSRMLALAISEALQQGGQSVNALPDDPDKTQEIDLGQVQQSLWLADVLAPADTGPVTTDEQRRLEEDFADKDPSEKWPFTLDDIMQGKASINAYRINGYIGTGGMARVFKAVHEGRNEQLAVKILRGEIVDDDSLVRRFIDEFQAVNEISHPNIIKVYQQGFFEGNAYIVMEFLPMGDLRKRIRRGIDRAQAIQFALQIAAALQVLHQHGVLHRDLKPANVLFRDEQTAVLADFGLAKHLTRQSGEMALTRTGMVVGTLNYSSPEQIGAQPVDHRCDQFSLGLVLYEMLVGMRAFIGKTPVEVALKLTSEPAPRLPEHLSDLQPLMDRLLAKQADERYETTADVIHALETMAAR